MTFNQLSCSTVQTGNKIHDFQEDSRQSSSDMNYTVGSTSADILTCTCTNYVEHHRPEPWKNAMVHRSVKA